MKNVVILHGTGENSQSFWFPWLTQELEKKGYTVSLPELPDTDNPDLKKWLPVALQEIYTEETILIGHSSGCPLLLSVLQNSKVKIKQAILVAAFVLPNPNYPEREPILQDLYNWEKIKSNVKDLIIINSDNDPWECNDKEGRYILDQLGNGKLIIPKGEGHMGSEKFNQPYKTFPLLLKFID